MWQRNFRHLAVIFIFLLAISFVLAQEINVGYPKNVGFNDEFEFKVELIDFPEDNYSIKVDITQDGKRIARIWDPEKDFYQSTFYFVDNAVPLGEKEATLKLKITEVFEGIANIQVKVRDIDKENSETFSGYEIQVVGEKDTDTEIQYQQEDSDADKAEEEAAAEAEKEQEEKQEKESEMSYDQELFKEGELEGEIEEQPEVLVLSSPGFESDSTTPQDIKIDEARDVLFTSGSEKVREYALYGFTFFLILLIILIIVNKDI